jgi:hypothetical protein
VAPATGTALLILVAFVLPGFISLVVREATYVIRDATTPFERLLLSLSYSALIYGVLLLVALAAHVGTDEIASLYHGRASLGEYVALGAATLLVLPVTISEVGRRWRRSKTWRPRVLGWLRISPGHSTQSGWDHFFGGNTAALVRATLDDGRVVAGYFGEASLAGYSEDTQDLFLERRWELDDDGWFLRPAPASLGIWLSHKHVVSLEVYEPPLHGEDAVRGAQVPAEPEGDPGEPLQSNP